MSFWNKNNNDEKLKRLEKLVLQQEETNKKLTEDLQESIMKISDLEFQIDKRDTILKELKRFFDKHIEVKTSAPKEEQEEETTTI